MPKIKSSIKDMRRTKHRREANQQVQSRLKTALRNARTAKPEEKAAKVQVAYKVIDKAVQSGIIHRNTGANYKSGISRKRSTV